jgi:hypothetical protein
MYPNNIQNGPVFEGPYVPYFYQSGLYRFNAIPSSGSTPSRTGQGYAQYDFSSEVNPWSPSREPQTVEQIIAHGYFAAPRSEPEFALISDRKHTSWLGLEDAIQLIRGRYEVYQRNLYDIEFSKCSAVNSLLHLIAERGDKPSDSREAYAMNKTLQRLYQEQREERVSLWQDVARVRQTLPEVAQLYLSAYRKMEILDGKGGDAP